MNIEQLFKKIIIAESRPTSQEFQEEIVTRMSELSCKFTHSGIIVPHIVWLEVGSFVQALAQYDVLGIVVLSVDLSCKVKEDLQTVIRSKLERAGERYSRIKKRGLCPPSPEFIPISVSWCGRIQGKTKGGGNMDLEQLFKRMVAAASRPQAKKLQDEVVAEMSMLSCQFGLSAIMIPFGTWVDAGSLVRAVAQYAMLTRVLEHQVNGEQSQEWEERTMREQLRCAGGNLLRIKSAGYIHILLHLDLSPFFDWNGLEEKLKEEGIWT